MRKKIGAIVFTMMLLATLALPATLLAHGGPAGDTHTGCHYGRGHENPFFNGKAWGEFSSTLAKSEPGNRSDRESTNHTILCD